MRNAAQIHLARNSGGNATVAANVRAELGRAGLKQGALAEVLGLSEMAISRRLADATEFTAGEIVLIAEFFDVGPGDLFYTRRGGNSEHLDGFNARRTLEREADDGTPVTVGYQSRDAEIIPFPTAA